MSSLSDFSKNFKPKPKQTVQNEGEVKQQINQNFSQSQQNKMQDDIASKYDSLKGKSQDQLMSELFKEGQRLKANGQFNYDSLYQAIQNMSGMLSPEQKETMLNLLNKLK